ncbi:MAG: hypothetical protein K1X55_13755 [Chitinophagales bacterium]|nr:hypothetical protein [Chitinophagales bacterium]
MTLSYSYGQVHSNITPSRYFFYNEKGQLIKKGAVQLHITIFDSTTASLPLLETYLTKQTDTLGAISLPNVMDLIVGSEIDVSKQYFIQYEYKAVGESTFRTHSLNPIWLWNDSDSIPEDGRKSNPKPPSVSGDVPIIKYYVSGDVPIIRSGENIQPSMEIPIEVTHDKDSIPNPNSSVGFSFKNFYLKDNAFYTFDGKNELIQKNPSTKTPLFFVNDKLFGLNLSGNNYRSHFSNLVFATDTLNGASWGIGYRFNTSQAHHLSFAFNDGKNFSHILELAPNGNVGIGLQTPKSRLHVRGGDIFIEDAYSGIIFKSTEGKCYRLNIENDGIPKIELVACPM